MKKQAVLSVLVLGLVLSLAGASAHAQDDAPDYKFSLFGGYSYLINDWGNGCEAACDGSPTDGLHGYTGSTTYNIKVPRRRSQFRRTQWHPDSFQ